MAFEIHDSFMIKREYEKAENNEKKASLQLQIKYQAVSTNLLDMWAYSCCYIGILTGVYFYPIEKSIYTVERRYIIY